MHWINWIADSSCGFLGPLKIKLFINTTIWIFESHFRHHIAKAYPDQDKHHQDRIPLSCRAYDFCKVKKKIKKFRNPILRHHPEHWLTAPLQGLACGACFCVKLARSTTLWVCTWNKKDQSNIPVFSWVQAKNPRNLGLTTYSCSILMTSAWSLFLKQSLWLVNHLYNENLPLLP